MRGRPKTTNQGKRIRGTDQNVRMDKEFPPTQPMAVDEISADHPVFPFDNQVRQVEGLTNDRQRSIYVARCKTLAAMGIMEEAYQEAMILYAVWLDLALSYSAEAAKGGSRPLYDNNGRVTGYVNNPYVGLFKEATRMVNEIGRNFGFSPITRNNIKLAEKQINPVEELKKLMAG